MEAVARCTRFAKNVTAKYPHQPLYGQTLEVVVHRTRNDEICLIVTAPGAYRQHIPSWMTEDTAKRCLTVLSPAVPIAVRLRKSKLSGNLFLDLIIFNSENLKSQSLNDLSVLLKNEHGLGITKQNLHDRFSESAVVFLKDALENLLRKQLEGEANLLDLDGINRILIKDSVCFQVDESLLADYPGSGGSGSKASVRI